MVYDMSYIRLQAGACEDIPRGRLLIFARLYSARRTGIGQ